MRTPSRLLALTLLTLLAVGVLATPALAHGRGSDASNFLSTITDAPDVEGLEVTIVNSDEYLQLVNDTGEVVIVPGYSGEPYLRFEGLPGEQWTMFLLDPAGNALEFKAFADDAQVFAT